MVQDCKVVYWLYGQNHMVCEANGVEVVGLPGCTLVLCVQLKWWEEPHLELSLQQAVCMCVYVVAFRHI